MKTYKVNVDGQEIVYGALIENSRFSEKEWNEIYSVMVKTNYPEFYNAHKNEAELLNIAGDFIDLSERYEALLQLLPQDEFSIAGTHPKWVADAVEENTLDKYITKDDISNIIDSYKSTDNIDDLKNELIDYFDIEADIEVEE